MLNFFADLFCSLRYGQYHISAFWLYNGSRQFGGCACAVSRDPYVKMVKSNPICGFRIPMFPVHYVTLRRLLYYLLLFPSFLFSATIRGE